MVVMLQLMTLMPMLMLVALLLLELPVWLLREGALSASGPGALAPRYLEGYPKT